MNSLRTAAFGAELRIQTWALTRVKGGGPLPRLAPRGGRRWGEGGGEAGLGGASGGGARGGSSAFPASQ